MKHGELILTALVLGLAACGGGDSVPDANLTHEIDAEPPPIDGAACALTTCGADCVDTDTDTQHCGDCDTVCTQTGSSCVDGDCVCPTNFLPEEATPSGFDQVFEAQRGLTLAAGVVIGNELDVFGVGYSIGETEVGVAYTLDGATLPEPPLAFAIFNVDPTSDPITYEAAYAAIDGTLTLDTICDVGASGTLTDATFQAATLDLSGGTIALDPAGCTFEVTSIAFTIGEACPVDAFAPH